MNGTRNRNWLGCVLAAIWLAPPGLAQDPQPRYEITVIQKDPSPRHGACQPRIQIALLLDTSNSMDGLIAQAKSQLWRIVNEFIPARLHGRRPRLEVALLEYGNSGLPQNTGYIRIVSPFTNDLDVLSEKLFALRTNGGHEYCGQVIQRATHSLRWSPAPNALKLIFIAGNEPFTQGAVPYYNACRVAAQRGIAINTIFCGNYATGAATAWRDGALLAGGEYLNIDQNAPVACIVAPQDNELAKLGVEINVTYIPYGSRGSSSSQRQMMQDSNAGLSSAGSLVQRAITKGSQNYINSAWDLVDAVRENLVKLEDLDRALLPENMRTMTIEQQRTYVLTQQHRRTALATRIQELNRQRQTYVADKMKTLTNQDEHTLDTAVIRACRTLAGAKGFVFE